MTNPHKINKKRRNVEHTQFLQSTQSVTEKFKLKFLFIFQTFQIKNILGNFCKSMKTFSKIYFDLWNVCLCPTVIFNYFIELFKIMILNA